MVAPQQWVHSLRQEYFEDRHGACFTEHPEEEEPERILKQEVLGAT